jgi:hypothetical protein
MMSPGQQAAQGHDPVQDLQNHLQIHLFQNIHHINQTVKVTEDIIDSIERDVQDVKQIIRNREQQRFDQGQLLQLLQAENQELHVCIIKPHDKSKLFFYVMYSMIIDKDNTIRTTI